MDRCRQFSLAGGAAGETDEDTTRMLPRHTDLADPADSVRCSRSNTSASETNWQVVVKQTFIEIVARKRGTALRRSMSDSQLHHVQSEISCIAIPHDKIGHMSDRSTDVSFEAEDLNEREDTCLSADEADHDLQDVLPRQFVHHNSPPVGFVANQYCLEQFASSAGQYGYGCSLAYAPVLVVAPFMHPIRQQQSSGKEAESQEWRTTVMIRNMPNDYTRDMLLEFVDSKGFVGTYDFAYLPIDFQTHVGLGYAFVNFVSVELAELCFKTCEGFRNWNVPSEKVCTVDWSSPTQGLAAHVERYRNSTVMHDTLPDEWKPVLFERGVRVAFPPPTKLIKAPKVRAHVPVDGA